MASTQYRSRFGDTTLTKVFVGGLAWETPNEKLRRHFEQFGEILEAVVITDKATGRSKGYGFVTFRDPESARRACVEPNPVIDGRRANCNIASEGLPRPSARGRAEAGNTYQGGRQHSAQPYNRIPPQMPPPPPPGMYPPYGVHSMSCLWPLCGDRVVLYITHAADYGYQPAIYSPHLATQYQHHMYGPTSPSRVGPPYPYPTVGYTMQTSPRAGFPLVQHMHRMQGPPPPPPPPPPPLLPFVQYPAAGHGGEASFVPSSSNQQGFQLTRRSHNNTSESQAPQQQQTTTGASIESSDAL